MTKYRIMKIRHKHRETEYYPQYLKEYKLFGFLICSYWVYFYQGCGDYRDVVSFLSYEQALQYIIEEKQKVVIEYFGIE